MNLLNVRERLEEALAQFLLPQSIDLAKTTNKLIRSQISHHRNIFRYGESENINIPLPLGWRAGNRGGSTTRSAAVAW